jgi:hypothetical protein
VFGLIEQYLSKLGIDEATKVLFIADGAKWIWKRVGAMFKRLGLKPGFKKMPESPKNDRS